MLPIWQPKRFDLTEMVRTQERVAAAVVRKNGFKKLDRIAGCDISFSEGDIAYAACAVLDHKSLEMVDKRVQRVKLRFPYMPTFLAFRELEGMISVVAGVDADVFMVGAQGLAHPRRAGLACHLGVVIDKPTIGVAKSKLIGEANEPQNRRGAHSLLKDGKEIVGSVVRTKRDSKPVYVSIGNKIDLKTAVRITLETTKGRRLPEPLHVAHRLATEAMRKS